MHPKLLNSKPKRWYDFQVAHRWPAGCPRPRHGRETTRRPYGTPRQLVSKSRLFHSFIGFHSHRIVWALWFFNQAGMRLWEPCIFYQNKKRKIHNRYGNSIKVKWDHFKKKKVKWDPYVANSDYSAMDAFHGKPTSHAFSFSGRERSLLQSSLFCAPLVLVASFCNTIANPSRELSWPF